MTADLYERLAQHLNELPAGFPRTADGAEMRILRRLFTPEDAELALHLTMLPEEARVVALRAGIPVAEAVRRLEDMTQRGLIFGSYHAGRPPRYMAYQFAVGVWEAQVMRLSPELAEDVEQYFKTFGPALWKSAPQLRTIPVGKAVASPAGGDALRAGRRAAGRAKDHRCHRMHLPAGNAAAGARLRQATRDVCCARDLRGVPAAHRAAPGASIWPRHWASSSWRTKPAWCCTPGNSQMALGFCACCGCCSAALRTLKLHDKPAQVAVTPFVAQVDTEVCRGCGTCAQRCQMEAIAVYEDFAALDTERCIGCGLCVSTCPSGAVTLVRKPQAEQRPVPADTVASMLAWSRAAAR